MEATKQYDKEREMNVIWTLSENYSLYPDISFLAEGLNKDQDILALYHSVILGGFYKYLNAEEVLSFFESLRHESNDVKLFHQIIGLCIEEYCLFYLEKERFAIKMLRQKAYHQIITENFFKNTKTLTEDVRKSYYIKKSGKIPPTNSEVSSLIQRIESIVSIPDSDSFLPFIKKLFADFFHFEFSFREGKVETDKTRSSKCKPLQTSQKDSSYDENMEVISDEYTSAEFSSNVSGMDNQGNFDTKNEKDDYSIYGKTKDKIHHKIEAYYGSSIYSEDESLRMENKFCTGIHKGQKLHITKGIFSEENKDSYRMHQLDEQRKENIEAFYENFIIHKRNINRLKEIFSRTIIRYQDESYHKSDNGKLNSSIAWRSCKVNDNQIFFKDAKEESSSFTVDILLDSSGSQIERQSRVAIQGYILSQALSLCNITNRVSSFNNFMDYTIIKIFRDYNDSITKNTDIFNYYATGSNRDGLAIRWISDCLYSRPEENKILIILSDGKPNDIRITAQGYQFIGTQDYKGKVAINDTALEIRKARMKEISVLGVFTGEDEDLETEKLIYGKDFAYIHDIERFSDIVGLYLKREIKNILEDY